MSTTKKPAGEQEAARLQSNADAINRVAAAYEIAAAIHGPGWNQQAAVALARVILSETSGSLDVQLNEVRERTRAALMALPPKMPGSRGTI